MAMGKRKPRQESLVIATDRLAHAAGQPFYQRLKALLDAAGFDRWIQRRCQQYYEPDERRGPPRVPPGVYFRRLLVGYFAGIDRQRGIAGRCADRRSLRQFLGLPLDQGTPDHSTRTHTRQRLPPEVFAAVFQFVLKIAVERKRVAGQTVGGTARRGRPTRP